VAAAAAGAALALSACGGGGADSSTAAGTVPAGIGVGPSKGTLATSDAVPVIDAYLARIHAQKAALISCTPAPAKKYELLPCKVTLAEGKKALIGLRVMKLGPEGAVLQVVGVLPSEKAGGTG
jgi:hypothetical protein